MLQELKHMKQPFQGQMKQIKMLTYSMDLALFNKYLQVIIRYLASKIYSEKFEVLFDIFI